MLVFFTAYFVSIVIECVMIEKLKYRYKPFPKLKLNKFGIEFFSTQKHRIFIANNKILFIGNNVYLKTEKQVIVLDGIKNVICKNEHMYFTACGNVKIVFNCEEFYKYFNMSIKAKGLDFSSLKQTAILDLMNSNFQAEQSKKFNKFLNFIKKTLKICVNDKKISVYSNNLKISYILTYKINQKIKRINVQNTIGKN